MRGILNASPRGSAILGQPYLPIYRPKSEGVAGRVCGRKSKRRNLRRVVPRWWTIYIPKWCPGWADGTRRIEHIAAFPHPACSDNENIFIRGTLFNSAIKNDRIQISKFKPTITEGIFR